MIEICEIIGVITKDGKDLKHKVKDIFDLAVLNKHRGESDGFGMLCLNSEKDKWIMRRSTTTFDEIEDNELNAERLKSYKQKKNIQKAKTKFRQLKKYIDTEESEFIIFHHRKASCGTVKIRNTHPFKIGKGIYYMHNGSMYDINPLRNYLRLIEGFEFKSATDTEVLSQIFESILQSKPKGKEKKKKLQDKFALFSEMFYGYGVLVRIDTTKKELMILTDWEKNIYLLDYPDYFLLISEPPRTLKGFKHIFYLSEGIFRLGSSGLKKTKGKVRIVTDKYHHFVDNKEGRIELYLGKCEVCNDDKIYVQRFPINLNMVSIDSCINCALDDSLNSKLKSTLEKEEKKQQGDNNDVTSLIGDATTKVVGKDINKVITDIEEEGIDDVMEENIPLNVGDYYRMKKGISPFRLQPINNSRVMGGHHSAFNRFN